VLSTLLVGGLWCVSVDNGLPRNDIPVAKYSALEAARLEISLYRGHLSIHGHAASERQELQLLKDAERHFSSAKTNIVFKPLGTVPDYWEATSSVLLEILAATESAHVLLTDKTLRIRGVSTNIWHETMSHLRAVLPEFIDLNVDMIIVDEQLNARDLCSRAFAEYRTGAINFEESTTLLRSSAKGALDRVVSLADSCRESTLTITGHTDSSGPEAWNRTLSLARADAVADYVVSSGIARARLFTVGAGSSEAIASNASRYGRSLNRRIAIDFQAARGSGD